MHQANLIVVNQTQLFEARTPRNIKNKCASSSERGQGQYQAVLYGKEMIKVGNAREVIVKQF